MYSETPYGIIWNVMTVRMRHTKGQTGSRRSHHKLTEVRFSVCPSCKATHVRHTMCANCGTYRGRTVVDAKGIAEKRLVRRNDKLKAIGATASKAKADSSSE